MASSGKISQQSSGSAFASEIFNEISKVNTNKNIVISPVSIQTCIAMGYLGAVGKTAEEMSIGLHFNTNNKNEVASKFELLTNSTPGLIKIANKIYANKLNTISTTFNADAQRAFHSKAESIDFSKSAESIKTINDWVEDNTNKKIKNLLPGGSVDGTTQMILVNAIHFKGDWVKPFSTDSTHDSDFWNKGTDKTTIKMMTNSDPYKYAEFPDLDATAIDMKYKNSEVSMMIILPKERTGLSGLLAKLKETDVLELANSMHKHDVDVTIPKFKIEFDINLNNVLKSMKMGTMFSDAADFSGLFETKTPCKISDVVHKAVIDVNEAGTEAAAATFMKVVLMSLNLDQKRFRAEHPFVYVIKDKNSIYFVGQVVNL